MANPNLFTDLPAALPEELFSTLLQTPGIRIERIVSKGHKSANGFWYDQPTGEIQPEELLLMPAVLYFCVRPMKRRHYNRRAAIG